MQKSPMTVSIGPWSITPVIEAVGPFLNARVVFPNIDAAQLALMLDSHGDRYSNQDRSQLMITSQGFLIRGNGRTLLVDTCTGGEKPHRAHTVPGFVSPWLNNLAAAGVQPDDVDVVISTHLHHDHVGWNTTLESDGTLRPTFGRARHFASRVEYEYAITLAMKAKRGEPGEHIRDSVVPIMASGQLLLADPETTIETGIRLIAAPGHTPGHSIVEVTGGGHTALLSGDIVHHPLQFENPSISSAMCVDPEISALTRDRVLAQAASTGAILFVSHLPSPVIVRAQSSGSGYDYEEIDSSHN